jgi:hypothetical protein
MTETVESRTVSWKTCIASSSERASRNPAIQASYASRLPMGPILSLMMRYIFIASSWCSCDGELVYPRNTTIITDRSQSGYNWIRSSINLRAISGSPARLYSRTPVSRYSGAVAFSAKCFVQIPKASTCIPAMNLFSARYAICPAIGTALALRISRSMLARRT